MSAATRPARSSGSPSPPTRRRLPSDGTDRRRTISPIRATTHRLPSPAARAPLQWVPRAYRGRRGGPARSDRRLLDLTVGWRVRQQTRPSQHHCRGERTDTDGLNGSQGSRRCHRLTGPADRARVLDEPHGCLSPSRRGSHTRDFRGCPRCVLVPAISRHLGALQESAVDRCARRRQSSSTTQRRVSTTGAPASTAARDHGCASARHHGAANGIVVVPRIRPGAA